VVTTVLLGGRTEVAFSCKNTGGGIFQANWVTGLIPGHPFELDLKAAGINTISAYSNYSWGKSANGNNYWWGCISPNQIISARQIGGTLAIGGYGNDKIQDCGVNLTKK
jgi:hypothetical protein